MALAQQADLPVSQLANQPNKLAMACMGRREMFGVEGTSQVC